MPAELGGITTLERLGINGNPRLDPTLPSGLSQNQLYEVECQTRTAPATLPSRPGTSPAPQPAPTPAPTPAPKRPRLAAALTAAPAPVRVGESVTYTLTVTNPGTVPLSGVFWRSPVLGVARRAVGDGALAVGAAVAETTFSFGPVTEAHQPRPHRRERLCRQRPDGRGTGRAGRGGAARGPDPDPDAAARRDRTHARARDHAPTPRPRPRAADPRPAVSDLDLVVVRAFYSAPDPPDPHLGHNILALQLTLPDGTAVACDFLTHYQTTGGLARWGYATSEILEEREGALTQYYQRGAVDCHFRAGQWRVERRLTWDFIGGGVWAARPTRASKRRPAERPARRASRVPGAMRVSNFAVDGTYTGFLDFFHRARRRARLRLPQDRGPPRRRPGRRAAAAGDPRPVSSASTSRRPCSNTIPDDPADPVKLGLAGDVLRDLLLPQPDPPALRQLPACPHPDLRRRLRRRTRRLGPAAGVSHRTRPDLCVTPGVVARKTLTPTLSQRERE